MNALINYARRLVAIAAALLFGLQALSAHAATAPDVAIRTATDNLLGIIEQARGYYDADPERYYKQVDSVIGPLVDFNSFSRGVMGRWGSRAYYESLADDAAKAAYREQVKRFSDSFREGLVRTYSKGLLAFSGETIEVAPIAEAELDSGQATVEQRIVGEDNDPLVIRYNMKRGKDGEWKVRNVMLDSLNLGKVYRNQFADAAGKYNGDLDQVINNWSVSSAGTSE